MSLKKTAKLDAPHAVWKHGDWEWRVLKTYKTPAAELKDVHTRWFCAVKSPYTYGAFEYGDVHRVDITKHAILVDATAEFQRAYDFPFG